MLGFPGWPIAPSHIGNLPPHRLIARRVAQGPHKPQSGGLSHYPVANSCKCPRGRAGVATARGAMAMFDLPTGARVAEDRRHKQMQREQRCASCAVCRPATPSTSVGDALPLRKARSNRPSAAGTSMVRTSDGPIRAAPATYRQVPAI